jgi:hypothetical protein
MVAENLTRQPDPRQAARSQPVPLGDSMALRLPLDELDAAGCAPRIPTAGVQDIDMSILLDRQHEPLLVRHFERSVSFDG